MIEMIRKSRSAAMHQHMVPSQNSLYFYDPLKYCIVGAVSLPLKVHSDLKKKKHYRSWGWLLIHLTHNSSTSKWHFHTVHFQLNYRPLAWCHSPYPTPRNPKACDVSAKMERSRKIFATWNQDASKIMALAMKHHGPILSSTIMSIANIPDQLHLGRCLLQSYLFTTFRNITVKTGSTHFHTWIYSWEVPTFYAKHLSG